MENKNWRWYALVFIACITCGLQTYVTHARLLPQTGSGYLYESDKYHGKEPTSELHKSHQNHWPYKRPNNRWYRKRPYYHFNRTHYDYPHEYYHYPHGGYRYVCAHPNYGYYYCNKHEYERYYRRVPYLRQRYWYIYQPFYRRPIWW